MKDTPLVYTALWTRYRCFPFKEILLIRGQSHPAQVFLCEICQFSIDPNLNQTSNELPEVKIITASWSSTVPMSRSVSATEPTSVRHSTGPGLPDIDIALLDSSILKGLRCVVMRQDNAWVVAGKKKE